MRRMATAARGLPESPHESLTRVHRAPVATTLLTVAIAIAGIIAFVVLPVSPLPQVDFRRSRWAQACREQAQTSWRPAWRHRWSGSLPTSRA